MQKSIEPYVKEWFAIKMRDNHTECKAEQDSCNYDIETALKKAPSKSGGKGSNRPDFQILVKNKNLDWYPVVVEAKGTEKKLQKLDENGHPANLKADGKENFANISGYAVNGAVHYANAIIDYSHTYNEVFAVGINGYDDEAGNRHFEAAIYFVSKSNAKVPKLIGTDISLLYNENHEKLILAAKEACLTEAEKEELAKNSENIIENNLKNLNQMMHDDLNISVGARVKLVTGMIMAGLGVPGKCSPLEVNDLKGNFDTEENDGQTILNKIRAFLKQKELPEDKRDMILADLSGTFRNRGLWEPKNGLSKLKTLYAEVKESIIPYIDPEKSSYLDFTGKLFNVLTEWVDIPDGGKNDVVLTPRYVTDMMAKMCKVNMDSFVWDYATGTAGFLVSSMKLMLQDAEKIESMQEREKKKAAIRGLQLLGVEKRPDIYLLGVLNMILMGDGTSNIIQGDSLTEYDGNYGQGIRKGEKFPANVFLLNPPYSADGKGFVFVEKALARMNNGRAAVLIQENAGSGNGLPYTKRILEKNTLLASIHMADIFKGKAGVQTAIYVFEVGTPHHEDDEVVFVDMTNDGYTRQNRKKASASTNLRNTDHAYERYQEVIDLVLRRRPKTNYYLHGETLFYDTVGLNGDDWTFSQHKKIDRTVTVEDFKKTVADYLSWKVGAILRGEIKT